MDSTVRVTSVRISTIAHATEDLGKVEQAIRNLFQSVVSANMLTNRAKGHHGNEIITKEFVLRDAKAAEGFLQYLWTSLSPLDRVEIISNLPARIDSAGTLFLRIDKQEARKGKIRLNDTDPIKIAVSFQTMPPRDREFVDNIRKKLEDIQG